MEVLHEINVARLWQLLKDYRWTFIIVWVVTAAFALMVGFSTPKIYKSEVKLAPETSNSSFGGSLSSLTSMMGLKMNDMTSTDAILPTLYPDVVTSPDFLLSVLKIRVTTKDGSVRGVDYKTYLTKHTRAPWWTAFTGMITKMLSPKPKDFGQKIFEDGKGPIMLSHADALLLKGVGESVSCDVDKKTDVITISVVDQDPLVATTLVDSVSSRLQSFITDYRTKKARGEVQHLEQLHDQALRDYQKAQRAYAAYADAHTDLVLAEYKVKEEDLENEMQLRYNVYSQLVMQLKTAQAKVQERTPVYTVIQAPMVPYKHVSPKKLSILVAYLFFSTFCCFLYVYYKDRKCGGAASNLVE